jgi:hypothetical protein
MFHIFVSVRENMLNRNKLLEKRCQGLLSWQLKLLNLSVLEMTKCHRHKVPIYKEYHSVHMSPCGNWEVGKEKGEVKIPLYLYFSIYYIWFQRLMLGLVQT